MCFIFAIAEIFSIIICRALFFVLNTCEISWRHLRNMGHFGHMGIWEHGTFRTHETFGIHGTFETHGTFGAHGLFETRGKFGTHGPFVALGHLGYIYETLGTYQTIVLGHIGGT